MVDIYAAASTGLEQTAARESLAHLAVIGCTFIPIEGGIVSTGDSFSLPPHTGGGSTINSSPSCSAVGSTMADSGERLVPMNSGYWDAI